MKEMTDRSSSKGAMPPRRRDDEDQSIANRARKVAKEDAKMESLVEVEEDQHHKLEQQSWVVHDTSPHVVNASLDVGEAEEVQVGHHHADNPDTSSMEVESHPWEGIQLSRIVGMEATLRSAERFEAFASSSLNASVENMPLSFAKDHDEQESMNSFTDFTLQMHGEQVEKDTQRQPASTSSRSSTS